MQKWLKVVKILKSGQTNDPNEAFRLAGMRCKSIHHVLVYAAKAGHISKVVGNTIFWSDGTRTELKTHKSRKAVTKDVRKCMTCGSPFLSSGPHNRICTECKTTKVRNASWALI